MILDRMEAEREGGMAERLKVHMPTSWSAEKKAKFLDWLNDELSADEARDLLRIRHSPTPSPNKD